MMTDERKSKERDMLQDILDQQSRDACARNIGFARPVTVVTSDGIPWTVTGKLAARFRAENSRHDA